MKNYRNFNKWEAQARQFFGDDFWNEILSVLPQTEGEPGTPEEPSNGKNGQQSGKYMTHTGPAVDIYRTDRQLIVLVELPGLPDPSAIDVALQSGQLVVKGYVSRPFPKQAILHTERFSGEFKRVIPLDMPIEEDKIKARYKNGLLEISLPIRKKRREDPPYRIPIRHDP